MKLAGVVFICAIMQLYSRNLLAWQRDYYKPDGQKTRIENELLVFSYLQKIPE